MAWQDGCKYEGEFVDDKMHGRGRGACPRAQLRLSASVDGALCRSLAVACNWALVARVRARDRARAMARARSTRRLHLARRPSVRGRVRGGAQPRPR